MAESTTSPAPASAAMPAEPVPTLGSDALRIVLFGIPAAGKSSLLGALIQAAQTQEYLLHGRLIDLSKGHLAELHRRLYEGPPQRTAEEIAPFPVAFVPFTHDDEAQSEHRVEALLIDCDGNKANELLRRRRSLSDHTPEGTLARAVLEADTLVLVVDASAPAVLMDSEFNQFGQFLGLLEQGRGQRAEVGGLPVYLVLSKCDLLAEPNDTAVDWLEKIEERKRQVYRRFQDFLARQSKTEGPMPFGRIELHLWATAVKRPALQGAPARPKEPYGVAELFRQCLDAAQAYRLRRRRSSRHLVWAVGGAAGALLAMVAVSLGFLFLTPHAPRIPLSQQVTHVRASEGETASQRLSGPLQPRISLLTELKNDPDFSRLPEDQQEYVQNRLQELEAYRAYKEQVDQLSRRVQNARNEGELREAEDGLTKLQVPESYRTEWSQTEAVLERQQRLKDVTALRRAADDVQDWFVRLRRDGERLLTYPVDGSANGKDWGTWLTDYRRLLETAGNPPFHEEDPLPNSALTYGNVFRLTVVAEARGDWERVARKLERVRDLAAVLGLLGSLPERPAELSIPRNFTVHDARERLLRLKQAYPHYQDEFNFTDLPDTMTSSLRKAARGNYDKLMDAGREEVLRHLQAACPEGRETTAGWAQVRDWLSNRPEELTSWRALARVLGPLSDASWTDPVDALADFLSQTSFSLDLAKLTLDIPTVSLDVRPNGQLIVHHQPAAGGPEQTLAFNQEGTPFLNSERNVRTYTFRPAGDPRIQYRPGDDLWATLPVTRSNQGDWVLSWIRGRSAIYQLDHLVRTPQLQPKDASSDRGEPATGVTLTVAQGSGPPPVPALMPVVKLERR